MNDITSSADYLKHVHIDDLEHYCTVSKIHYDTCNDRTFWIQKFNCEGLKIPATEPTTLKEWIYYYKKLNRMTNSVINFLNENIDEVDYESHNIDLGPNNYPIILYNILKLSANKITF